MTSREVERLKVLGAGIISLILMLGIARFAYTPLLPVMQQQAGLGAAEAGWLAAINYVGYLCGAILASAISDLTLKDRLYRVGLIIALITTAGMAVTENLWLWAAMRFFAGLSSAAGLLIGSGLILHWLIRHDHRSELGIHFSGLGLGIAFSAIAVAMMEPAFDWREQWLLLTAVGVLMVVPAWAWLPRPETTGATRQGTPMIDRPPGSTFVRLFMAAYFCAGVGYVVSATFIVAIVDQLPGLQGQGNLAFLVIGLAAAPACIFWDLVARRIGDIDALIATFCLQIVGILLPVVWPSTAGALIGAAFFGGTFIGLVSLVLTMAGRFYPTRPAKMMGKMTIAYGVAQIGAPALTGMIAEVTGTYANGLYIAAVFMALGSGLMLVLKYLPDAHIPTVASGTDVTGSR
jgi:predicted MFS family arabinose efflux permease